MKLQTPQNIDAEQAILGAILIDHDSLMQAIEHISPENFFRKSHQIIFSACLDVYQFGEDIDIISLSERLRATGDLETVGGIGYLSTLANNVTTVANVNYHARLVKEKAALRKVRTWAADIARQIEDGTRDFDTLYSGLERDLNELSQKISPKKIPYAESILSDIRKNWDNIRSGAVKYIPMDYKLSALIPGFFPHLWFLGGYTSNGKSSLLNQIIVDGCEEGIRPVIFSLEDSREEKMMKLISNLADIPQRDLMTGDIEGKEKEIQKAEKAIRQWSPIFYDDVYSIHDIRLKAKKHKLRDNINMICIDYVQNLTGQGDLYQVMREASIQLDKLKKDLQCTIIALSQVTNESVKSNSEVIALKGSGDLAAAADIVLWLKRIKGENKEHFLDCEIRKNRPFGATGIIPLMFSDRWTRIEKRGF